MARLQNAPAGLYAIEKGRTSALPIDAALIGAANWALVQAASRKKDLQRIVGDVSRWTERAGALLPGITAAMQAIERGRSRPESLALEETALWVAGDHLRPSVTIATPLLRPFVDRAPVGKAGREGAAVVLARRMPAERLPSDLQPLGACALLLRSWGLDLILWTARALGGTDRLLAVARANPGLDDPYVARALLELAVGHPRCDLGSFLAALPALAEAVRGAPQAWTKRRALVLQMIDAIFEQTTGAARGNSAKAKRKRLRSMLTVPGGDRWERERELLDAALEYSGDPFGALDGVSRWYLGMSIPETMVKGALVAAGADVHGIRKELATRLGRFTPRPALDPGGFVERFTSIAARIAGEANAAALLRRIARWISHCISACAPGSTGDGGLHLAWRGLARLCSLNEPAPWSAPLLIEILAEHGDVLLERRIESAKHRKDGRFDATSAGVLTDHLTGDRHVSTVASLGFAAGVSRKDVRELIERDLLVQLGPVLYRDPSRLRPLFTWLRANPSLMQDTMSWATQLPRALFHWIDDPVLRGQAQRWCDHLFLRSGSSWDGVEGIFYEAFRETELHAFVAKNFFVIEAITDAAFAAAAKNPDSTASGFWRNSNALGVAWKWSALGHPDVAGMLSALLDAAVGGKIPSEKPYREAMLAIELSGGDVVRLLALLERASISAEDAAAALAGWEDLKKYPALGRLFRRWAKSKDRVGGLIRLLTSWAFATQLPARNAIKQALAEIDRTLTEVEGSAGAVDLGLGLLEELRRSAGTDEALPSAIREIVDHSGRLEAEREALRRRGASATGPQRARLMKLEALLEDRAAMERQTARELRRELPKQIDLAAFEALRALINRSMTGYWERTLGAAPPEVEDPDWVNALHLVHTVKKNKRILKQLLRHVAKGAPRQIWEHAGNRRFLEGLAATPVDSKRWLETHRLGLSIAGQELIAATEEDPLRVLQMGNLFGTCLSTGGVNAFSAIANAVEANKRVLYVRDQKERVVARKLILLLSSGALLGYASYGAQLELDARSSLGPWLKILLDLLCAQIAHSTGARFPTEAETSIADDRSVEGLNLFAEWYNDGTEPFDPWIRPGPEPARLSVLEWVGAHLDTSEPSHPMNYAAVRALLWLGDDAASLLDRGSARTALGPAAIDCLRQYTSSAAVHTLLAGS